MNKKASAIYLMCFLSFFSYAETFDESLSAINKSTVGVWEGTLTIISDSGEESENFNSFTFITTDSKGLDFAFWRESRINWEIYDGDGVYTAEVYGADGSHRTQRFLYSNLQGPDEDGNWSYELTELSNSQTEVKSRMRYWMESETLHFVSELKGVNSKDGYQTRLSGSFTQK